VSNVIDLPTRASTIKKLFCDCGHTLEYWLGDDNCAYGICPVCDVENAQEIIIKGEGEWTH
jgi:hypothetical protein